MRTVIALAFAFSVAALASAQTFNPSIYTRRGYLAPGAEMHWVLSGSGANQAIRLAVTAPTTTGWIGFGVGEYNSGSMPGADIAIVTVAADGSMTVGDYHALGFSTPVRDCESATSDWAGLSAARNATHTTVELTRRLAVTHTSEDRTIVNDGNPTKFIFAYGDTATLTYHGRTQRAMASFNVFDAADPIAGLRADASVRVVRWGMTNYNMPSADTTYAHTQCINAIANDASGRRAQIVAFESQISPEANRPYIHHIVVRAFDAGSCEGVPIDLYAVASVHTPFVMPSDIGLPLTYGSYNVEIHYDNPERVAGVVDNSGINVYYTYEPRQHQAGILQLGDSIVSTPTLLESGYTRITYDCPSSCTRGAWASNITVFGELLHMHQVGHTMRTDFIVPGGPTYSSEVEWYEFHTQQNTLLPQRFTVPPGVETRTSCTYNVQSGSTVRFGLGSNDEMCIHFVYYYPVQRGILGSRCGRSVCGNQLTTERSQTDDASRVFNGSCGVTQPPPPTPPTTVSASASPAYAAVITSLLGAVAVLQLLL